MKKITLGIAFMFSLTLSASSFAAISNEKSFFEISDKEKEKKKKSCCASAGHDKKKSGTK